MKSLISFSFSTTLAQLCVPSLVMGLSVRILLNLVDLCRYLCESSGLLALASSYAVLATNSLCETAQETAVVTLGILETNFDFLVSCFCLAGLSSVDVSRLAELVAI